MNKKSDTTARAVRVGLISLGCAKNLVDAEIMLGSLMKGGMEITNDAAQADVVIVNTCSFIDSAQEESVDAILQSAELREAQNRGQGLIVSGCLPQRFREELPKLLPEVDAFMGIDQVAQVSEVVREALNHRAERLKKSPPKVQGSKRAIAGKFAALEREAGHGGHAAESDENIRGTEKFGRTKTTVTSASVSVSQFSILNSQPASTAPFLEINPRPVYIPDFATPRFRLTARHFAYVKIAGGCNHPCSFCIIPRMRGSHRSREQSDIAREARQLIADGVRELNLISQDSTYYGLDLRPNHSRNIASPEKFNLTARARLRGRHHALHTAARTQ